MRSAALLCPISSIPGPDGIGTFGPELEVLVRWMASAGFRYWQVLPITVPDALGSPYASSSLSYGNWLHIGPSWLPMHWQAGRPKRHGLHWPVSYTTVLREHMLWLLGTYQAFQQRGTVQERRQLSRWQRDNTWITPVAEYFARKDRFQNAPWWKWPHVHIDDALREREHFYVFLGWIFDQQWQRVRQLARQSHIRIVGDLPFYPREDSVEVWAGRANFQVDRNGHLSEVGGVPPDRFSADGQRWGNPVYNWDAQRRNKFRYWAEHFKLLAKRFDVVRLDHFIGYRAAWHIPARAQSAKRGHWVRSPGEKIFAAVRRHTHGVQFIAEDLGVLRADVTKLRKHLRIPGTRVWQFGWNGLPDNPYARKAITADSWFYTSTHDSNTVRGWWERDARWYERKSFRRAHGQAKNIGWQACQDVLHSKAMVAVVTIPDLLNLGQAARFNRPGTRRNNWQWRFNQHKLTRTLAALIQRSIRASGRR